MVYKSGQIFLPFCHNSRVWPTDRQTDRRTDGRTDGQTEFSSLYRVCITCSAVKMTTFCLLHYKTKHSGNTCQSVDVETMHSYYCLLQVSVNRQTQEVAGEEIHGWGVEDHPVVKKNLIKEVIFCMGHTFVFITNRITFSATPAYENCFSLC